MGRRVSVGRGGLVLPPTSPPSSLGLASSRRRASVDDLGCWVNPTLVVYGVGDLYIG